MKTANILMVVASLVWASANRSSGQDDDPFAVQLADSLSEDVVAIIDVDAAQFQGRSLTRLVRSSASGLPSADIQWMVSLIDPLESQLKRLNRINVRRIAILLSLDLSISQRLVVVAQLDPADFDEASLTELADQFPDTRATRTDRATGIVVLASDGALDRIDPRRRQQLQTLLAIDPDAAVKLLIIPSHEQRRVIREMLPAFAPPFDSMDGPTLAAGWIGGLFSLKMGDQPAIVASVQSENDDAAEHLRLAFMAMMASLGDVGWFEQGTSGNVLDVDDTRPTRDGDSLRLELAAENGQLQRLFGSLRRALRQARQTAADNDGDE